MMMSFKAVVTLQSYSAVMEGGRPLCSPGDQSLNGQHWGGGAVTGVKPSSFVKDNSCRGTEL